MLTILKAIAGILAGIAIALTATFAIAAGNGAGYVSEDSPYFNCYTMGNGECNVDTYVLNENGDKGAVMEAANDGVVYVAWPDGSVTPATEWQRYAAWETCIAYADGSDASMFACDDAFQNDGDSFSITG